MNGGHALRFAHPTQKLNSGSAFFAAAAATFASPVSSCVSNGGRG